MVSRNIPVWWFSILVLKVFDISDSRSISQKNIYIRHNSDAGYANGDGNLQSSGSQIVNTRVETRHTIQPNDSKYLIDKPLTVLNVAGTTFVRQDSSRFSSVPRVDQRTPPFRTEEHSYGDPGFRPVRADGNDSPRLRQVFMGELSNSRTYISPNNDSNGLIDIAQNINKVGRPARNTNGNVFLANDYQRAAPTMGSHNNQNTGYLSSRHRDNIDVKTSDRFVTLINNQGNRNVHEDGIYTTFIRQPDTPSSYRETSVYSSPHPTEIYQTPVYDTHIDVGSASVYQEPQRSPGYGAEQLQHTQHHYTSTKSHAPEASITVPDYISSTVHSEIQPDVVLNTEHRLHMNTHRLIQHRSNHHNTDGYRQRERMDITPSTRREYTSAIRPAQQLGEILSHISHPTDTYMRHIEKSGATRARVVGRNITHTIQSADSMPYSISPGPSYNLAYNTARQSNHGSSTGPVPSEMASHHSSFISLERVSGRNRNIGQPISQDYTRSPSVDYISQDYVPRKRFEAERANARPSASTPHDGYINIDRVPFEAMGNIQHQPTGKIQKKPAYSISQAIGPELERVTSPNFRQPRVQEPYTDLSQNQGSLVILSMIRNLDGTTTLTVADPVVINTRNHTKTFAERLPFADVVPNNQHHIPAERYTDTSKLNSERMTLTVPQYYEPIATQDRRTESSPLQVDIRGASQVHEQAYYEPTMVQVYEPPTINSQNVSQAPSASYIDHTADRYQSQFQLPSSRQTVRLDHHFGYSPPYPVSVKSDREQRVRKLGTISTEAPSQAVSETNNTVSLKVSQEISKNADGSSWGLSPVNIGKEILHQGHPTSNVTQTYYEPQTFQFPNKPLYDENGNPTEHFMQFINSYPAIDSITKDFTDPLSTPTLLNTDPGTTPIYPNMLAAHTISQPVIRQLSVIVDIVKLLLPRNRNTTRPGTTSETTKVPVRNQETIPSTFYAPVLNGETVSTPVINRDTMPEMRNKPVMDHREVTSSQWNNAAIHLETIPARRNTPAIDRGLTPAKRNAPVINRETPEMRNTPVIYQTPILVTRNAPVTNQKTLPSIPNVPIIDYRETIPAKRNTPVINRETPEMWNTPVIYQTPILVTRNAPVTNQKTLPSIPNVPIIDYRETISSQRNTPVMNRETMSETRNTPVIQQTPTVKTLNAPEITRDTPVIHQTPILATMYTPGLHLDVIPDINVQERTHGRTAATLNEPVFLSTKVLKHSNFESSHYEPISIIPSSRHGHVSDIISTPVPAHFLRRALPSTLHRSDSVGILAERVTKLDVLKSLECKILTLAYNPFQCDNTCSLIFQKCVRVGNIGFCCPLYVTESVIQFNMIQRSVDAMSDSL